MVRPADRDEYLHNPPDKRLWNESYYWNFNGKDVRGVLRMGFLPYERRGNVWCYLVSDGDVYWFRDERINLEAFHGLHVDTGGYNQSYWVEEPHREWRTEVDATMLVASDTESVFEDDGEDATVAIDMAFTDPLHETHEMDMLVDTQRHYSQHGRYEGEVTLDGSTKSVSTTGFRDHSWGWFRDWTPGEWGHYGFYAQFPSEDCFQIVAQVHPDGGVRRTFGYHVGDDGVHPIEGGTVDCDDGLEWTDRGGAWAAGEIPEQITVAVEFDGRREELICVPSNNVPLAFEDHVWPLSDPAAPWQQSAYQQLPLRFEWENQETRGWMDSTQPL